jgi:hypothetical protein
MPFILGSVLAAAPAEGSERPEPNKLSSPLVLENEFLRITVDVQTGAILGIANRKTQTEYMARRPVAQPPLIIDAYSANQAVYIRDPFEKQSGGFSTFDPQVAAGAKGDLRCQPRGHRLAHRAERLLAGPLISKIRARLDAVVDGVNKAPFGTSFIYWRKGYKPQGFDSWADAVRATVRSYLGWEEVREMLKGQELDEVRRVRLQGNTEKSRATFWKPSRTPIASW